MTYSLFPNRALKVFNSKRTFPVNSQTKKPAPNVSSGGNDFLSFQCSYFLSFRFYSRLLAIFSSHFVTGVKFLPYTFRCSHTKKSSAWSNQFSSVLSIFNGSSFFDLPLITWLDDLFGFVALPKELLEILPQKLAVCTSSGLKLNPTQKSDLVKKEVQFCGRIFDTEGIKFNQRRYEVLSSTHPPSTIGSLMTLVHCANCMQTAIRCPTVLIAFLQQLLEYITPCIFTDAGRHWREISMRL